MIEAGDDYAFSSDTQIFVAVFAKCQKESIVRIVIILLVLMMFACYWGLNTTAGRSAFDEMAGMIPLAAVPLGLCFAGAALFVWWKNR